MNSSYRRRIGRKTTEVEDDDRTVSEWRDRVGSVAFTTTEAFLRQLHCQDRSCADLLCRVAILLFDCIGKLSVLDRQALAALRRNGGIVLLPLLFFF